MWGLSVFLLAVGMQHVGGQWSVLGVLCHTAIDSTPSPLCPPTPQGTQTPTWTGDSPRALLSHQHGAITNLLPAEATGWKLTSLWTVAAFLGGLLNRDTP